MLRSRCILLLTVSMVTRVVTAHNIATMQLNVTTLNDSTRHFESRGFLLSQQAQSSVNQVLQQMPSGWTELGIPPLAPYTKENLNLNIENDLLNFQSNFHPLNIIGLDKMLINQLNVGAIFRKVFFDFTFPKLNINTKFDTSLRAPILGPLANGLALKSAGNLNLTLENLNLTGSFGYKLPFLLGSSEVHDFKTAISLADLKSLLTGTVNAMPITQHMNSVLEKHLFEAINGNGNFWNAIMVETVVPHVNALLKGKSFLNLVQWVMSDKEDREKNVLRSLKVNSSDFIRGSKMLNIKLKNNSTMHSSKFTTVERQLIDDI